MRATDGSVWDGCPRTRLYVAIADLRGLGYSVQAALEPQVARSIEGGAEWRARDRRLRGTLFRIDVDDEIHLDPFTAGVGNTNLPPSRRRGVELDGEWRITPALQIFGAYAYTDAKFLEGTLPGGPFVVRD